MSIAEKCQRDTINYKTIFDNLIHCTILWRHVLFAVHAMKRKLRCEWLRCTHTRPAVPHTYIYIYNITIHNSQQAHGKYKFINWMAVIRNYAAQPKPQTISISLLHYRTRHSKHRSPFQSIVSSNIIYITIAPNDWSYSSYAYTTVHTLHTKRTLLPALASQIRILLYYYFWFCSIKYFFDADTYTML